VRVRLTDGRTLEARAPDGRGGPGRPLPPSAIIAKYRDNAARALPRDRVDALEQAVLGLDRLSSVRTITALCRS